MNNVDDLGQPWSCEQWGESHEVKNPVIIDGQSCLDCNNNYPIFNWFGYAYTDYVFIDHNMKVYYLHNGISSYLANSIIQEMLGWGWLPHKPLYNRNGAGYFPLFFSYTATL